jgi:hypothetical protein
MSTYYSWDEETFNCDLIDEAVECAVENDDQIKVGDCICVYSGESEPVDIKSYVPDIMGNISEASYDDCGEWADNFPDAKIEVEREIQAAVENLVAELFHKHKLMPSFYKVKNVKTIEVRINNVDQVSFEVISK